MLKKISVIGILTCILYFISVGLFLITKADIALTIWELMTVISGPLVLLVMIGLAEFLSSPAVCKKIMLVSMGCTCALTGATHIVNITVTRRLIAEGINVPTYFQIGQWPSVEMAVDYLAWGFFMGLTFLAISFPLKDNDKTIHRTKIISLFCGIMCLTGFCGAIFINENMWYLAPMAYGFGLILLCIQILKKKYKFYGWQTADCKPADPTYEKIQNPRHLYDILSEIWCEYTCAPRLREKWSRENLTVGQCSITAFLAQDIFGGKVYGILRQGGNYHCYNVVGDCVFDLTSEQFGDEKLCYENNPEQFRETHWQKTEKHERYNYLKAELLKKLEEL